MLGILRDALDADCAMMAGGNIRADKDYTGEKVIVLNEALISILTQPLHSSSLIHT
jgi:hypothetical protein